MKNTEADFGTGAIPVEKDPKIAMASDVVADVDPFDWNLGCDIELKVGKIKVKNQMSSGSCGGQASSYLEGVLEAIRDNKQYEEKSARYVYAPVAVPGGGSSEPALINRMLTAGDADEVLIPSNRPDGSTDETFMTDTSDIDNVDIIEGLKVKGLTPLYYTVNIDNIAQAIRDNGGVIVGLHGSNNGTWLSEFPQTPVNNEWAHWLYFGKAKMINGKKYIGTPNSWGLNANSGNWQWIGEDYLSKVFAVWGLKLDTALNSLSLNKDLKIGMRDIDVTKLQYKLKKLGFFPQDQELTNYFGAITQQSLIKYQKANQINPPQGYCGPITRKALNKTIIASAEIKQTNMNIQFKWEKFLTITGSALLIYIATNLNNISWTKAGIASASVALIQFVAQALVKNLSNNNLK